MKDNFSDSSDNRSDVSIDDTPAPIAPPIKPPASLQRPSVVMPPQSTAASASSMPMTRRNSEVSPSDRESTVPSDRRGSLLDSTQVSGMLTKAKAKANDSGSDEDDWD